MKIVSIALLSIILTFFSEISSVRISYVNASKSQKNTEEFYNLMSIYDKQNQVLLAYKGAAMALQAKFEKQIKDKKVLFIEGAKLVDISIKNEPSNPEIRMIRLSIQENAPKVVNYRHNIEEDKKIILANFGKQDQALKEYLKNYIVQSKAFSDKEKNNILN